jgi:hypothetical protein
MAEQMMNKIFTNYRFEQRISLAEGGSTITDCVKVLDSNDFNKIQKLFGEAAASDEHINKHLSSYLFNKQNSKFSRVHLIRHCSTSQLSKMLCELYFQYGMFNPNHILNESWESLGQMTSKRWLVDVIKQMNIDLGLVYVLGGWYGTLSTMLLDHKVPVTAIRSFDIDRTCEDIARYFNAPYVRDQWKFQAATADVLDMRFDKHTYQLRKYDGSFAQVTDSPNTIINTSAEHMSPDWFANVPDGKLVIIQSNNFKEIEEHINTVNSEDELVAQFPMTTLLFKGTLVTDRYDRYMVVGYK